MKQFFCELLFSCSLLAEPAQAIDELTYGTVLYEYYQEDYQAALLNSLVAGKQGRRGENTVRFDLANGSFAFADGMYAYADQIFKSVPAHELTPIDNMRLAFHLSREYHRRGDWLALETQLSRLDLARDSLENASAQEAHPEVEYMRAELTMQQGDFAQAEQHFLNMGERHPLQSYGLFNLGVAYRDNQQFDAAKRSFALLADRDSYGEEAFDIQQRARLALAYLAKQESQQQSAESVLGQIPTEGRYQDTAMTVYGGLAMDNADYELAARIWMSLSEQEYWTPTRATAQLGLPVSLEKLGSRDLNGKPEGKSAQRVDESRGQMVQLALQHYQNAQSSFSQRLDTLLELRNETQDAQWVRGLLLAFTHQESSEQNNQTTNVRDDHAQAESNSAGDDGASLETESSALLQHWQDKLGHTAWLEWLSTDTVHQSMVQWQALNEYEIWLGSLPDHVAALGEVADERKRRSQLANALLNTSDVDNPGTLERRATIAAQIQEMNEQLSNFEQQPAEPNYAWMYSLANPDERQSLAKLERMRLLFQELPEMVREQWMQRVKRLEGVHFYAIVADSATRKQTVRTHLQALTKLLLQIDERIARVQAAEENFVEGTAQQFESFLDRADLLANHVQTARQRREALLASEIRERVQEEIAQVQQYLLITKIAIARATDQLALVSDYESAGSGR